MPTASHPRTVTQHHRGSDVTFVDINAAGALLINFLDALDADQPSQRLAFMNYARQRAEQQLVAWGIAR
ncbi:hypothetical protein GGR39_002376 [Novosphingobium fluoreni]|uniref:Uncharacterized protein n=1 Tax=Novosphingobium fluoreni TaxID=1391222 RepID=A0A7W6C326_9SPHN|nr:hypothetical protein [Novosphingobium fluoreni]MBB3940719.1 hypothetical protein [Novosphingobium fluoreni]